MHVYICSAGICSPAVCIVVETILAHDLMSPDVMFSHCFQTCSDCCRQWWHINQGPMQPLACEEHGVVSLLWDPTRPVNHAQMHSVLPRATKHS